MKKEENKAIETEILHTPYQKLDPYNSLSIPVYNAVAFEFDSAEAMEKAFLGQSPDHTYSRITNPTVQYFEQKIQKITNAHSVTALNSGMAAISNVLIELAYSGANIVTSDKLFGNTFSIISSTLKEFGVEPRFCDLTNLEEVESKIDENTCCIFTEIITNPQLIVVDLSALSEIAQKHNVPFVADTTIIPFTKFKAKDFGVNIEVFSSTKYISGGATSLGGIIIDYGTFDYSHHQKLKKLSEKHGKNAFTEKLRKEIHRNLGAYMTPQVAYMQTLGLETLDLRYEKQTENALNLANKLQQVSKIKKVTYTGLKENPYYEISKKQFGDFPGAMITFDLESREACFKCLNNLKLIHRATNLFDNKSLAIHPASTIYGTLPANIKKEMDVRETTIRLSVGLENVEDLLNDIVQALN